MMDYFDQLPNNWWYKEQLPIVAKHVRTNAMYWDEQLCKYLTRNEVPFGKNVAKNEKVWLKKRWQEDEYVLSFLQFWRF